MGMYHIHLSRAQKCHFMMSEYFETFLIKRGVLFTLVRFELAITVTLHCAIGNATRISMKWLNLTYMLICSTLFTFSILFDS